MPDRVRVQLWCSTCVAGLHLPAFAAQAGGLFAERGLEVELTKIVAAPDKTLSGLSERVRAVADGRADFAFTSIAYFLSAQAEAKGRLPARFAAVFHRRNPIAALVAADSQLEEPADLAGRRATSSTLPWFAREYEGALDHFGLDRPVMVDRRGNGGPVAALEHGEIDAIPALIDMLPVYAKHGLPLRAIPLDIAVYGSGLVAAERLPSELVARVTDALREGFELQREQPELGIAAYRRRFPNISGDHLRSSWAVFEPYAFAGPPPGSMDVGTWQASIDYTTATHGLPAVPAGTVYRPELLTPAGGLEPVL